jgi:hypothetical protein
MALVVDNDNTKETSAIYLVAEIRKIFLQISLAVVAAHAKVKICKLNPQLHFVNRFMAPL